MGANECAFWRQSTRDPELAHLTEARVLESLLDLTIQPPYGTDRETKTQGGRDLPRILRLVGGRANLGNRDIWVSAPALLHLSKLQHLLEKGDKELGICEVANISRTQGLATGST